MNSSHEFMSPSIFDCGLVRSTDHTHASFVVFVRKYERSGRGK